ncbi:MAG: hypothetical protein R3C05_02355 [Pirellulaceae bacterium]
MRDSDLYQQTLVWIELRQREHHQAFNLPDPPEGWKYPRPSISESLGDFRSDNERRVVGNEVIRFI